MFTVVKNFTDKEDKHEYEIGDVFPFDNREVEEKRLKELYTKKNKKKTIFIKEIEIPEKEKEAIIAEYLEKNEIKIDEEPEKPKIDEEVNENDSSQ